MPNVDEPPPPPRPGGNTYAAMKKDWEVMQYGDAPPPSKPSCLPFLCGGSDLVAMQKDWEAMRKHEAEAPKRAAEAQRAARLLHDRLELHDHCLGHVQQDCLLLLRWGCSQGQPALVDKEDWDDNIDGDENECNFVV